MTDSHTLATLASVASGTASAAGTTFPGVHVPKQWQNEEVSQIATLSPSLDTRDQKS